MAKTAELYNSKKYFANVYSKFVERVSRINLAKLVEDAINSLSKWKRDKKVVFYRYVGLLIILSIFNGEQFVFFPLSIIAEKMEIARPKSGS